MPTKKPDYSKPDHLGRVNFEANYDSLHDLFSSPEFIFMNHGIVSRSRIQLVLNLKDVDKKFQHYIRLLAELTKRQNFQGKRVLEVSSGRGGNCYVIQKYLKPKSVTGVDISKRNVRFCKKRFSKAIQFLQGTAMNLPVQNESADLLINIEASHAYPSRKKFFAEAHRVLTPGGRLLYTDLFGGQQRVDQAEKDLQAAGLRLLRRADITKAVKKSVQMNSGNFYRILENASKNQKAKDFAFHLVGHHYPEFAKRYSSRRLIYHVWILEKPK